ncbi:hypothetical protein [Variovorax sp. UC74_104]|uniref:hypothetical protein n=1 Tax=Variovorax sp. UC74_104 TaxID=3374555 RepID=UPI0037563ECA
MSPRSMARTQALITLGWVMSRGRKSRSCAGNACAKASTASASSAAMRRRTMLPSLLVTVRG